MVASSEGLRARTRRLRRQAIEDAALSMFTEQGFEATTVNQIVEAVDVSQRTFFHYFPTKEDVVLGDLELRLARLTELLAVRLTQETPSMAVRLALLEVAEDYEAERDRILRRLRLIHSSRSVRARSLELQAIWEDRISAVLAEHMTTGPGPDPRPDILAAVTLGSMRIAQRRWLSDLGRGRLPDLLTETLDLLDQGTSSFDR